MEVGKVFAEGETFGGLGLREELVCACRKLGWTTPTVIQAQAIPHALQGRDLIGLAQTGSGKTGAFALPIVQKLMDDTHPFFACVVAPTRELAVQISKDFEALGSCMSLKCAVIMGGTSKMDQVIALAKRPHILVATPGRLLDHLTTTKGFSLRMAKYLVLDEADKLLNADFEQAINDILKIIPRERTTFLFSATMTEKVRKLKRACLMNPVKVEASSKYATNDTLKQQFVFVPAKQKDLYLVYILKTMARCTSMVFTQTCDSTRLLASTLQNLGLKAVALHGQMKEEKRLGALEKFKVGECNILVSTDVGSRGLDLEVDTVINYDIPRNSKDYLHRVGRTARAGRSGIAISLVNQFELEWFSLIEKHIKKKLSAFPTEDAEVESLSESVTEAKRSARKTIQESAGNKTRKRREDEDDDEFEMNTKTQKNGKSTKNTRRK